KQVVECIYTDLAIIDVKKDGLFVREMAPNVDFETLQKQTSTELNQYS
ncbi:MAG: 3-oxoadipate CoA-transferase, partial [Bacteroidetes bacterium]